MIPCISLETCYIVSGEAKFIEPSAVSRHNLPLIMQSTLCFSVDRLAWGHRDML